jgi:hypothetical protein
VGLRALRLPALILEQDVRIGHFVSTLHVIRLRTERGSNFQATFDRNEEELRYLTELHRKKELSFFLPARTSRAQRAC